MYIFRLNVITLVLDVSVTINDNTNCYLIASNLYAWSIILQDDEIKLSVWLKERKKLHSSFLRLMANKKKKKIPSGTFFLLSDYSELATRNKIDDEDFIPPNDPGLENLEPPRKKAFLDLGKSQRKSVLGPLYGQVSSFAEDRSVEVSTVLASLGTKHYY